MNVEMKRLFLDSVFDETDFSEQQLNEIENNIKNNKSIDLQSYITLNIRKSSPVKIKLKMNKET